MMKHLRSVVSRFRRGGWSRVSALAAVVVAAPAIAPQLLAFPYQSDVNGHRVRSVEPITPAVVAAVREADQRVAAGPLSGARPANQAIFLTGGGWRWTWLAAGDRGAMALTRAVNEAIIVNRLDSESPGGRLDVRNGRQIGGHRSLSGVVAHEMTHGSIRAHFGWWSDLRYSRVLREGLCDYVAGGGSLTDVEARALRAAGRVHPALLYWEGRSRVAADMAKPGATVDRLFEEWRD